MYLRLDGQVKNSACKAWCFPRGKDIHRYIEILKKYHNAAGRIFYDAKISNQNTEQTLRDKGASALDQFQPHACN